MLSNEFSVVARTINVRNDQKRQILRACNVFSSHNIEWNKMLNCETTVLFEVLAATLALVITRKWYENGTVNEIYGKYQERYFNIYNNNKNKNIIYI